MLDHNLVEDFLGANTPNTTDYQIQVGDRFWNVHSHVLFTSSVWFDNRIKKHPTETTLSFALPNAWDLARVLQFLYIGDYEYSPNDTEIEINFKLLRLMKQSTGPSEDEVEREDLREEKWINLAVFELAAFFEIAALQQYIAPKLVYKLKLDHFPSTGVFSGRDCTSSWVTFSKEFIRVYEILRPYLAMTDEMKDLETALVDLFYIRKVTSQKLRQQRGFSHYYDWEETDEDKSAMEELFEKVDGVDGYAAKSSSFCFKLMKAYKNFLEVSSEQLLWTKKAHEASKSWKHQLAKRPEEGRIAVGAPTCIQRKVPMRRPKSSLRRIARRRPTPSSSSSRSSSPDLEESDFE